MRIELRDRDHEQAFLALAGSQHLSIFAALQHAIEGVEAEAGFRSFRPVTADAGSLENGVDVLFVGHARLLGWGRQFTGVNRGGHSRGADQCEDTELFHVCFCF
jgi:hypothetical protein